MSDDNIDGLGTQRGDDIDDFRPFSVASLIFLVIAIVFGAVSSCITG